MKKEGKEKSVTRRTLHYYWKEMMHYKLLSFGTIILTPIVTFGQVTLVPYLMAQIVTAVTSRNIPTDQLWSTFWPYVVGIGASYIVLSVLLDQLRLYACWKMEISVEYQLADQCFVTINQQSMHFHNNHFGGSLVSQVGKFVAAFERLYDTIIWSLLPLVSAIVFTAVVLWQQVPLYVVFLLMFVAVYVLVSAISFRRIANLNEAEAQAENKRSGRLADSITNIASVKSYSRERQERNRFRSSSREVLNTNKKLMWAVIKREVVFTTINTCIIMLIVIFLVGGRNWFGVSVGTLLLIVTYSQAIISQLWDLNNVFRNFNRSFGDAYEMTQILDTPNLIVDAEDAADLKVTDGAIDFNKTSFTHTDGKDAVFHGLDLHIQPGERIGLVGRSGSGKTTFTKLLLRFADVDSGTIEIDGQNIARVTQHSLRTNIAYVPQETTLFHRTIAENIAYGRPGAAREEIIEAAKLANAWEFIVDLPDGLETLTGERGVKLSGGQRQRVAIARAILKDAPILVLDEATASLDTESEKLIQEALSRLMKGRTSIIIAHRLSTVAELDRIIVLENGSIVEDDTHHNLIQNGGIYARLWNKQTGTM